MKAVEEANKLLKGEVKYLRVEVKEFGGELYKLEEDVTEDVNEILTECERMRRAI